MTTKKVPRPINGEELRVHPCAWGHTARGRVGPGGIRVRGRSSNHSGNDGGTQKGTLIEVQRDIGVETKRSSQSPKCKHDTEGVGGTAKLPWKFLELWPGGC